MWSCWSQDVNTLGCAKSISLTGINWCLVFSQTYISMWKSTHALSKIYIWDQYYPIYRVSKKCPNRMLLEPLYTGSITSGWHHLGLEHSTQWLGYKENPTVLDRVPMSTEGKLSRIQRGWFWHWRHGHCTRYGAQVVVLFASSAFLKMSLRSTIFRGDFFGPFTWCSRALRFAHLSCTSIGPSVIAL